jgi:hypothetical protein
LQTNKVCLQHQPLSPKISAFDAPALAPTLESLVRHL